MAVVCVFVLHAKINDGGATRIEQLVSYTAFRPWVTRALVPQLVRAGEAAVMLTGISTDDLLALEGTPPFDGLLAAFFATYPPGRSHNVLQALLSVLVMAGFNALTILSARRLLNSVAPTLSDRTANLVAWGSPLTLLALMLGRDRSFGYVYDPATLGLGMIAFALLAKKSWRAYLVAFAIASINRETSIYLLVVFVAYGWKQLPRKDFVGLAGVQLATFAAIRGSLEIAALHLGSWPFVSRPPSAALTPTTFEAGLLCGVTALTVSGLWRSQSPLLGASAVLLPIAVASYWLAGSPGEIRVFLECAPVAVIAIGTTIVERGWRRVPPTAARASGEGVIPAAS